MSSISATELARNLSDFLNRVRYRRARFEIVRGGEVVATLQPAASSGATLEQLFGVLSELGAVPRGFADDLEQIQAEQPKLDASAWDT